MRDGVGADEKRPVLNKKKKKKIIFGAVRFHAGTTDCWECRSEATSGHTGGFISDARRCKSAISRRPAMFGNNAKADGCMSNPH